MSVVKYSKGVGTFNSLRNFGSGLPDRVISKAHAKRYNFPFRESYTNDVDVYCSLSTASLNCPDSSRGNVLNALSPASNSKESFAFDGAKIKV